MVREGIVLGHVVSDRGIEVDKAKVKLICKLPPPTSLHQIRSFLGHAGFYHWFIKNFSKISHPCATFLLRTPFVFDESCLEAYQTLKDALTQAPIIQPLDQSLSFEIMCGASDFVLRAVLGQRVDKKPVAIYFASRTLWSSTKLHHDRERIVSSSVYLREI